MAAPDCLLTLAIVDGQHRNSNREPAMTTLSKGSRRAFLCGLAVALAGGTAFAQGRAHTFASPGLQFDNVSYLHRWSKNDQHEATPEAVTDL